MRLGKWVMNVLIGLDQWANAILGGHPDETISSRAGKNKAKGGWWGKWLCRGLDLIDPGHCEDAIEHDRGDKL